MDVTLRALADRIDAAAREQFGDDLCGYCFVCSRVMRVLAPQCKVVAGCATFGNVCVLPHCWVTAGGVIYDPSVSQFKGYGVRYINPVEVPEYRFPKWHRRGRGAREVALLCRILNRPEAAVSP